MQVTIFGSGYVGLVQAAVLAEVGCSVVCVDIDPVKVERLTRGDITIYEPGLDQMVLGNIANGRLRFTTDAADGVRHGSIIFIAVGTPPDEDGSADLRHVLAVAEAIAKNMDGHRLVIVKSTVPVGTSDKVQNRIAEVLKARGSDLTFSVASNPEFLKEGTAVADCVKPDRIVIGVRNKEDETLLRELYSPFTRNHDVIVVMDVRSAELTKYAANCMLATKISFMNEMANLAERLGANIEMVRKGIGSDPRIGYHFIYPGIGYGGSCFPKDVQALIQTAVSIGFEPGLLKAVEERNNAQKRVIPEKILRHFNGDIRGRTFALWGLAFKPDTDDMREAPSRVIMEALWSAGAKVRAYDPKAMERTREIYGERDDLVLVKRQEEALEGADALVIATEWKTFRQPDFARIKAALKEAVIFDGRNVYDPAVATRHGLKVYGIGR